MPPQEGPPSERIRHYFSPEEILDWSEPIGPGRLFGIQYAPVEPGNIQEEHRYRMMEENPPDALRPTNWVFIGRVENKAPNRFNRPAIPLSSFDFSAGAPAHESAR